jgi:hypothetical protein
MQFWILEERDTYQRSGADVCDLQKLEPLNVQPSTAICPTCSAPLEPGVWLPPRRARPSKSDCGDLILGAGFELVISTDAERHLREDKISCFSSIDPVEMVPATTRNYVAARPRVTVTRLDEQRSHLRWRRPPTCDTCRLGVREAVDHVVIDLSTWDGSDIFMASGFFGAKIASQKFVDSVHRHGLTNFKFVRAEDYEDVLGRPYNLDKSES